MMSEGGFREASADEKKDGSEGYAMRKNMHHDFSLPRMEQESTRDIHKENIIVDAQQERTLFREWYKTLPEEHEMIQTLRSVVLDIGRVLGVPIQDYEVLVYDAVTPDVHVSPYGKSIRISRGFLEAVDFDIHETEAILAHEVGHVLLQHDSSGSDRVSGNEVPSPEHDPLYERTMCYEEEYQADRVGLFALHRLGRPTHRLRTALIKLEKRLNELYASSLKENDWLDPSEGRSWVLSTHPHTTRRISALQRLERTLDSGAMERPELLRPVAAAQFPERGLDAGRAFTSVWNDPIYRDAPMDIREQFNREATEEEWEAIRSEWAPSIRNKLLTINRDCFWNERSAPPVIIEVYGKKETASLRTIQKELWVTKMKYHFSPLEYFPDEVNAWTEQNQDDMNRWWIQAMGLSTMETGITDLESDIAEYSFAAIQSILRGFAANIFDDSEPNEEWELCLAESVYNGEMQQVIVGEMPGVPDEAFFVSSLLIREWFRKREYMESVEALEEILTFERSIRIKTGWHVPYDQARICDLAVRLFDRAVNDQERSELLTLFEVYADEFSRGGAVRQCAGALFAPVRAWLDAHPEFPASRQAQFLGHDSFSSRRVSDEEKRVALIAEQPSITRSESRDALASLRTQNTYANWTKRLRTVSQELWSVYHDPSRRRDDALLNRLREADPSVAAFLLDGTEVEAQYFGENRESYKKSPFGSLDRAVPFFEHVETLWNRAAYAEEIQLMPSHNDRVRRLEETFPVVCGQRDQECVRLLQWPELQWTEDIRAVLQSVQACDDHALLLSLQKVFAQPLLRLGCADRLWALFQESPDTFLAAVPPEHMESVRALASAQLVHDAHDRFTALLLCYPDASPKRDELLRPFIDNGASEEETFSIATLLSEPPPAAGAKREAGIVAATESILDSLKSMEVIDRQEVLLYLLGHRSFYSGFDALFDGTWKGDEEERRRTTMLSGKKELRVQFEDANPMYFVKVPDAVVRLSKMSGASFQFMVDEQKQIITRREQLDMLALVLTGTDGILHHKSAPEYLRRVAHIIVKRGAFAKDLEPKERASVEELLSFLLANCPEEKIPNLFLDVWNLAQNDQHSLPELTAELLRDYGPVFVKAGQYLATQTASLPPEWRQAFRGLSDKNRAADKTLVPEYIFAAYEGSSPFACSGRKVGEGSIAAVYEGDLVDGQNIAMKIYHPFIGREIDADTEFLGTIVGFMNGRSGQYGGVRLPVNLAQVTNARMRREIDPTLEATNAKELAGIISPEMSGVAFRVPQPIDAASRRNILALEWGGGVPIDDNDALEAVGLDGAKIREAIALESLRQMIGVGTYQADVNPGNFAVERRVDGTPLVHWLDAGHVGRLSNDDRGLVRRLVQTAVGGASSETLAPIVEEMIDESSVADHLQFSSDLRSGLARMLSDGTTGIDTVKRQLTWIMDFCADRGVALREQWVTLVQTLGLLQPMLADVQVENLNATLLPLLVEPSP